MKHLLYVTIGIAVYLAIASGASADLLLHAPETEPEKALDAILKRADADDEQLDNLFHRYGTVTVSKRVDYTHMLTQNLLAAMSETEKKLVKKVCGGHYSGEICGLDFSPITCAQDNIHYLYRTDIAAPHKVLIAAGGTPNDLIPRLYKVIKDGTVWKLDGVDCGEGTPVKFNMP